MTNIKMSLSPHTARQLFEIIGAVVDEVKLSISNEGWEVKAVDPANVVLLNVNMPAESFGRYEFAVNDIWTSRIDGHPTGVLEESIEVGIDVNTIKDFLGGKEGADAMIDDELHAPVNFSFSKAPMQYSYRYQLELEQGMFRRMIRLLSETDIRKAPKGVNFSSDYRLELNTKEFTRIVKKASNVSDYIRLGYRYETGEVIFTASTEDDDSFIWEAEKQVHVWQRMVEKPRDVSSSLFSLDFLHDIVQAIPSEKVDLDLGQDYPCRLSFGLGLTGRCEYLIAPRIESDKEE